jgi:3-phenylpropionate/trans-cinnamate dioxygenase ferredoxin subunit
MTKSFVKLASLSHLATGRLLRVDHAGKSLCLAYVDGHVYAVDDMCSHEDASLAKGSLHGDCVKCPLHGSRFDLKTGAALDEPAEDPINTYAVKLDGDDILVAI